MFRLDDKLAVVVGGAGGIGRGCATALAQQGAKLVIASRNLEKLEQTAKEINSETGMETTAMQVDASDEKSMAQLAEQVMAKYGRVDILVNAQGINIKRAAVDITAEEWDSLFAANVRGVMLSCREFGKKMIEMKKGKIINTSSIRGIRATDGGNEGYASTKGAVDMITRTLAIEWAPYNVNVNAVAPSLVMTETIKKTLTPERIQLLLTQQPMGRFGVLEDMLGAYVFLASPESDFITGQILYVDGGLGAKG
jgi:gluconate 5-dehydrogenase